MLPRLILRGRILQGFFEDVKNQVDVNIRGLAAIKYLIMILLSSHCIGCLFFWISRIHGFNPRSWVWQFQNVNGFDLLSEGNYVTKYLVILYRGFNAVTNLGYEGIMPNNAPEMVFSIAVILMQIVFTAAILGTLFHYILQTDLVAEAHLAKMSSLERFMEMQLLPEDLRHQLRSFFNFQYVKARENQAGSVELPRSLAMQVASCQFKDLMDRCAQRNGIFYRSSEQFLEVIMTLLTEQWKLPGEELMAKGAMSRELCFVASGTLELWSGAHFVRSIRGDMQEVSSAAGELAFFIGIPQPHSVRVQLKKDGMHVHNWK